MSTIDAALQREIQSLIATLLKLDPVPAAELRRAEVERWDSLKHVEIVFALEDAYGIQFEESEFPALSSASAIAALVQARRAA